MNTPLKQHLIDPEICIRCYTCEMTCPLGAIEHDDNNVVVNAELCNFCMDCIPVCPTGSIDEWRVVASPYSLEAQYEWEELPEQEDLAVAVDLAAEQTEEQDPIAALLAEAQKGAGGRAVAPISAAKPTVNLYNLGHPVEAVVQGNYPLTQDPEHDVRHIILDFQGRPFPVLEGQSLGILAPGEDSEGKAHLPRLYSVSSPQDGERPGYHNVSLTVKREAQGVCSNYICDLQPGDRVNVTWPVWSQFFAALRSRSAVVNDLHRHRIRADAGLHDGSAAAHRAKRRRYGHVFWRPHSREPALFWAAEQIARGCVAKISEL
jgi:benzoyl-CoA 2,3-dioxygenase component A